MLSDRVVMQMDEYFRRCRDWKLVAMRFQTTEQEARRAVRQWQQKRKSRS